MNFYGKKHFNSVYKINSKKNKLNNIQLLYRYAKSQKRKNDFANIFLKIN